MQNPIESVMARFAGATASIDARSKGLKGVFATLAAQHHRLDALLLSAQATTDFVKRDQLWRQIRVEVIAHEQGELLELYPVLGRYAETAGILGEHAAHATELEQLLGAVDGTLTQSAVWQPRLARFIARFHEHVQMEEQLFFPRAQAAIGVKLSKQLEKPLLRAQETARQNMRQ